MEYSFSNIVDLLRNLTLSEKEEVKDLLEHNISDEKREVFYKEYLKSKREYKTGKLSFSGNINNLRKNVVIWRLLKGAPKYVKDMVKQIPDETKSNFNL